MNETTLFDKISNIDNLYWAWQKAKKIYDSEDFTYNMEELVEFETNLGGNLKSIAHDIKNLTYKMNNLEVLPLPKGLDDKRKAQVRQNFYVSIRDQVAWIAIVNIIGPILDFNMPFWSFGSRLYLPVWYEKKNVIGKKRNPKLIRMYGKYRHTARQIYRNWSSSWPLFRKSIYITVKKMAYKDDLDELSRNLDEEDINDLDSNNNCNAQEMVIKYWKNKYWDKSKSGDVFWGAIDFSKFYPSVSVDVLIKNIRKYIYFSNEEVVTAFDEENIVTLLKNVLDFKINSTNLPDGDYDNTGIDEKSGQFDGIPTGLFVAGFLSNIAMLDVDNKTKELLKNNRHIAHFRFVDDHVFLADSIEELIKWINSYKELIDKQFSGRLIIKDEKTKPEALSQYLLKDVEKDNSGKSPEELLEDMKIECKLDPTMPSPLMTRTLKKVSGMNRSSFDLMDDDDKLRFVTELEHLLVTDFSDEELKKETRVSWAASMLNRVVSKIQFKMSEFYEIERDIELKNQKVKELEKDCMHSGKFENNSEDSIKKAKDSLTKNEKLRTELQNEIKNREKALYRKTFSLIKQAIRDNFHKPRIWKKGIDFCRSTGYAEGCVELKDQLDILISNEHLTKSTYDYLFRTIQKAILENIVYSYKCISKDSYTNDEQDKMKKFICFDFGMFFRDEINPLKISLNKLQLIKTLISDEGIKEKDNFSNEELSWIWWTLKQLLDTKCQRNTIINYALNCLSEPDCKNDKLLEKIVLLFPNENVYVSEKLFSSKETQAIVRSFNRNKLLNEFCCNIKDFDCNEIVLTLDKWICITKQLAEKGYEFITSEYLSLIIIKKIAEHILSNEYDSMTALSNLINKNNININPANFIVCFKDMNRLLTGVLDTKSIEESIEIRYEIIEQESDVRYNPVFIKKDTPFIQKQQLYSLGVILTQLVVKSIDFNPILNIIEEFEKPYYFIYEKVKKLPISSYTNAIILGCLTTRYYESQFIDDYIKAVKRDDSDKDPVEINSLNELIELIKIAQTVLIFHQMNVDGNQFRQLIPISLLQLNKKENPYFEV